MISSRVRTMRLLDVKWRMSDRVPWRATVPYMCNVVGWIAKGEHPSVGSDFRRFVLPLKWRPRGQS